MQFGVGVGPFWLADMFLLQSDLRGWNPHWLSGFGKGWRGVMKFAAFGRTFGCVATAWVAWVQPGGTDVAASPKHRL